MQSHHVQPGFQSVFGTIHTKAQNCSDTLRIHAKETERAADKSSRRYGNRRCRQANWRNQSGSEADLSGLLSCYFQLRSLIPKGLSGQVALTALECEMR